VKQVVVKHGGSLRVEDTVPGGQPPGTSIHVVLPGRPLPATHPIDADQPVVSAENA
jgi:two-component system sensor histidine kinase MprB